MKTRVNVSRNAVFQLNTVLVVASFLFLVSCKTEFRKRDSKPFINIDINGMASFGNDAIDIEDFIFSPVDSNVVWILNSDGHSYELSLKDSTWTRLDKRLGTYSKGLRKKNIVKDSKYSNLIWLSANEHDLLVYDVVNDTLHVFNNIKFFNSICFLDSIVAVGTINGLYIIKREQNQVYKSKGIYGMEVNKVEDNSGKSLLINGTIVYDYRHDIVQNVRSVKKKMYACKRVNNLLLVNWANDLVVIQSGKVRRKFAYPNNLFDNIVVDEKAVWLPFKDLRYGIIRFDFVNNILDTIRISRYIGEYKVADDKEYIWFYTESSVFIFNKTTYQTNFLELDKSYYNTVMDSLYFYGNTSERFDIYEKTYLLKLAEDYRPLLIEENQFKKTVDSLEIHQIDDFKTYYKCYKLLSAKYGNSNNPAIKSGLNDIKNEFMWRLPKSYKKLVSLERYIIDSVQDIGLIAKYYLGIIQYCNQHGKLHQSLKYDSILKEQFPQRRSVYHSGQMNEVAKSYSIIKAINASGLPHDVRLWKLGKAYYDLFFHVGPITECSSFDMTYPFLYLDSLLKIYPNSEYADDATFLKISHIEGSTHEGGDNSFNLEAIKIYLAFLNKYPQTVFAAEVYHRISLLSHEGSQEVGDEYKLFNAALKYADIVISQYPEYAEIEEVIRLRESIRFSLSGILWKLKIKANKKAYLLGEPVEVTFNFTNTDTIPQTIQVFKDKLLPNFRIIVKKYYNEESLDLRDCLKLDRNIESDNFAKQDTLIRKKMSFTEVWDITKCARDSYYEPCGKFELREPGFYSITAYAYLHPTGHEITSNTVYFKIKAK